MAQITLKGNPINTNGTLPEVGSTAPDFTLTDSKTLAAVSLSDFKGKKKLLNIVPSLDTPVCALSTRKLNEHAKTSDDMVLIISADLPFAQARFCSSEGLENVKALSIMHDKKFAEDYGVMITDGPFAGITARAMLVLDENDKVIHSELVGEIADEPDYQSALAAMK